MSYCVDTSGWLDGWQRHYPADVFPTLWAKLDDVIASGEIITSEEVYLEIKRKADDLHDWIQARKQMLVPLDESIQMRAITLLGEFPRLVDTLRGRGKADPFVLATAIERNAVVVTGEVVTGNMEKPRIPDVCKVKGIRCVNFLQMIRELRITF
jgi:predicted nucleic acid-binding protein